MYMASGAFVSILFMKRRNNNMDRTLLGPMLSHIGPMFCHLGHTLSHLDPM